MMSSSLSKILERVALIFICFLSSALFFITFSISVKKDMADSIAAEFVHDAESGGVITLERYERFLADLAQFGYSARISQGIAKQEPFYSYRSLEELGVYFTGRNIRGAVPLKTEAPEVVDVPAESVVLQRSSNASVFATIKYQAYGSLPGLPEGGYAAVMGTQELYAGEALVTLLYTKENGISFVECGDPRAVSIPGIYDVPIFLDGVPTGVNVHVTVWEREAVCENGHSYTATNEVVEHYKHTGCWERCPYCAAYAERVEVSPSEVTVPLGTAWADVPVAVRVTYLDGHAETVALSCVSADYNGSFSGTQTVSVGYQDVSASLQVTTALPACVGCGAAITGRSYEDCQIYKKCNACLLAVPMFLEEVYLTEEIRTDKEITGALLSDGRYLLGRGDRVEVEVFHVSGKGGSIFSAFDDMGVLFRVSGTVRRRGEQP